MQIPNRSLSQKLGSVPLTLALLTMAAPQPAYGQNPTIGTSKHRVTVEIGQPSVWSLGQAHYLLATLHRRNRDLKVDLPTPAALDPNRANAARLEILKTLLAIEGQFDQGMAVENDLKMQQFRRNVRERRQAAARLEAREQARKEVAAEIRSLTLEIASLEEQNRQAAAARAGENPPNTTPSPEENERSQRIAELKARKGLKEQRLVELDEDIAALEKDATADISPPEFESPTLSSAPSKTFGTPEGLSDFIAKAMKSFENPPSVDASTALDNFVGMQYEIIAKQLPLLRDEVGPDERVVFLELPSSIYTVDGEANGYVAQVEWQVTRVIDSTRVDPADRREIVQGWLRDEGFEDVDTAYESVKNEPFPITLAMLDLSASSDSKEDSAEVRSPMDREDSEPAANLHARTLDIIPRQSALNVNEYHAVSKQTGILAGLRFLFGFAGAVNYQRQRDQYQQFLQQEIFASGYGKGDSRFGWTFGPKPGSKRMAPGVRTTYAVLAVPRDTVALEIQARGRSFRRGDEPGDADSDRKASTRFLVRVPGEKTESFWVSGVSYSPVAEGKRTTVVIDGRGFSPQLSVLVNSVPLTPRLSLSGRAADDTPPASAVDGIAGQFEILNSGQMVLTFTMGAGYTGTPEITLVAPERVSAINSFKLTLNHRRGRPKQSLKAVSLVEPMFIAPFSLRETLENVRGEQVVHARLKGTGLRPGATVWVGDTKLGSKHDVLMDALMVETMRLATEPAPGEPVARTEDETTPVRDVKLTTEPANRTRANTSATGDDALAKAARAAAERLRAEIAASRDATARHARAGGVEPGRERLQRLESLEHAITALDDPSIEIPAVAASGAYDEFRAAAAALLETREYVEQESTTSYAIHFRRPSDGSWAIRYQQPTRQGFDTKEFAFKPEVPSLLGVRNYEFLDGAKARVTIAFDATRIADIMIDPADGERAQGTPSAPGLATFVVKPEAGAQRGRIGLTLTPSHGSGGSARQIRLALPIRPQIQAVVNSSTGKPLGHFDTEAEVVIRGSNLQNVGRVSFGPHQADILAGGSSKVIVVRAPKGVPVAPGEKLTVAVRLETDSFLDGVKMTNVADFASSKAFYTFIGDPKPAGKEPDKSVIVVVPKEFRVAAPPTE